MLCGAESTTAAVLMVEGRRGVREAAAATVVELWVASGSRPAIGWVVIVRWRRSQVFLGHGCAVGGEFV